MASERPRYDCDTKPYWCREADYHDRERSFGRFVEDGAAYEVLDAGNVRCIHRPGSTTLRAEHNGVAVSVAY